MAFVVSAGAVASEAAPRVRPWPEKATYAGTGGGWGAEGERGVEVEGGRWGGFGRVGWTEEQIRDELR